MTPSKSFTRYASKARIFAASVTLSGALLLTACGGYETEEKVVLTKGIVTEVEEVQPNEFKIIDEVAVEDTSDSKVIAHYLGGKIDTIPMQEVRNQQSHTGSHYHSSGMGNILMGGLMGYYLGRSLSSPIMASSYRDQSTYSRVSSNAGAAVTRSAVRTTVRKPSRSSSGYGSGRSTRSYGG